MNIKHFLSSPKNFAYGVLTATSKLWPASIFIHAHYYLRLGKKLDLKNPKTYNEKLQWLKLYNRNPLYNLLVDKYRVKKYVEEKIGSKYVIPCFGVWNHFEEIDFDLLPDQFVLKTNHDCGGVVVCKDKSSFDFIAARKKLEKHLRRNYYWNNREWPYKDVKPVIFAEKYMVDESGYELKDYKWFCFDGEPKMLYIAQDRGKENEDTKFDFYDMNFKLLPFTNAHPNSGVKREVPNGFGKMRELATKLSEGFPHIRVDFYDINGEIYFGEFTFFHMSGSVKFEPEEWDYKLGEYIRLPIE